MDKDDPLVKCPLEPKHVVHQSSLQRHLFRCMLKFPNHVVCPFNALHRFHNKDDLRDHMENCPCKDKHLTLEELNENQKKPVERHVFHIEGIREFNLAEEDWDAELQEGKTVTPPVVGLGLQRKVVRIGNSIMTRRVVDGVL